MPVVEVLMWTGRTREQKKEIIEGITEVFVKQGVPAEAVTVVLRDVNKSDWGTAGRLADEA